MKVQNGNGRDGGRETVRRPMRAADMHCDTITEIYGRRQKGEGCGILSNDLHIDLEKLEKGGYLLQNFAVFANLARLREQGIRPSEYALSVIDFFYSEMRRYPGRVGIARSFADIEKNAREGRLSALLTLEEGAIFEGKLSYLRIFYELGVRMATFTWNYPNELAFPSRRLTEGPDAGRLVPETGRGLTELGFTFLEEMERIGMIPDVSHLGDKGILDVIAHAKKPFAASHSNARAVCGHPRNLTDEMIRGIAEKGGVIGLNYYPPFLREQTEADGKAAESRAEWPGGEMAARVTARKRTAGGADLSDLVRHLRHLLRVGGEDCVGLGSDFDGISETPGMKNAAQLPLFEERLHAAGFSMAQIEKIFSGNVLRLYREILR